MENQINLIKKAIKSEPMVDAAYLFGSQALGEAGANSDFDIGVYLNKYLNGSERFKLRLDLIGKLGAELKTDKIDLVIINDLNSVFFKYIIIKEGKVLHQKSLLRRCELEGRIMAEYFDFRPFLEEYNRRFLMS
ncbi:MAG: nucleotidyltransferase domain-containing protein [bacterium]